MTDASLLESHTNNEIEYWIQKLSSNHTDSSINTEEILELEQLWQLMDQVWDEMGCDNVNLNSELISSYYKHPIWLLNGLFAEQHDISLQHREAISDWIAQKKSQKVLDFGGGFGTLSRMISDKNELATVDIYEPFPSQKALSLSEKYNRINFVDHFNSSYDCLVSTDVLEHVSDPIDLFSKMISSVRMDGYLLIANHFYPCIKCHLPATFHFRYSFDNIAALMGLKKIGICEGSHAIIYQKTSEKPYYWNKIRRIESISRILFPYLKFFHQCYRFSKFHLGKLQIKKQ